MNTSLLISRIKSYSRFLSKSIRKNGRGVNTPFAVSFILEILNDKSSSSAFDKIKHIEKELKCNRDILNVSDFGAGPAKSYSRKISDIYRRSVITPKYGRLLFRIAKEFDVKNILELGTSLGISSTYLAMARSNASVLTLEGCPEIADFARQLHQNAGVANVEVVNARFDEKLEDVLRERQFDLFYVDGNHTYEATKRYISLIQQYSSSRIVLILDDIHWSEGMDQIWNETIVRQEIRVSVDLYRMGILFFDPDLPKEHLVIRF